MHWGGMVSIALFVFVAESAVNSTCGGGPENGTGSPHAEYGSCNERGSGEWCEPTCKSGYSVENGTNATGFILDCDAVKKTYDASGFRCIPDNCRDGVETGSSGVDAYKCTKLVTGDVCNASMITCVGMAGVEGWQYVPHGEEVLVCLNGRGRVTKLECRAVQMDPGSSSVALTPRGWFPALFEVLAYNSCGKLEWKNWGVPWQFHPFKFPVGSRLTRYYSGALCSGLFIIATAFGILACVRRSVMVGLAYLIAYLFMPGMAFASGRIVGEQGTGIEDLALAIVGWCVCAVLPLALWLQVLRPSRFCARWTEWTPLGAEKVPVSCCCCVGKMMELLGGRGCWEPTNPSGDFSANCGLVFVWYAGRARWFLICEMIFAAVLGAVLGPVLDDKSACIARNWAVVGLTGVYMCLVLSLLPMRSVGGNVCFGFGVIGLFTAALLMAIGFSTTTPHMYSSANDVLAVGAISYLLRNSICIITLIVECRIYHWGRDNPNWGDEKGLGRREGLLSAESGDFYA